MQVADLQQLKEDHNLEEKKIEFLRRMKSRAYLDICHYEDQISRLNEERNYLQDEIIDNAPSSDQQEQLDIFTSREMCLQDKIEMRKKEFDMFELLISDHFEILKKIARQIVS